ncbi:MAG TPA: DUF1638 domain-containing protein [Bryobacteraceae bacterium]
MHLKLISCEIFYREMCAAVARSPNQVDIEFLPKGLHDSGAPYMLDRLQSALNAVDEPEYEAVLFGYGLCGMGLTGLTARTKPVVIPRAHDCITLFLGSRERYLEYFNSHPGVYFKTTGWIERGQGLQPLTRDGLKKAGLGYSYEELVEKYGEENAGYLWSQLGDYTRNYGQMTFIEMGVEPDGRFERASAAEAAAKKWRYEKLAGDMSLIHDLVDGRWNPAKFLVVPPGWRVVASHDESVIGAEKAQ